MKCLIGMLFPQMKCECAKGAQATRYVGMREVVIS